MSAVPRFAVLGAGSFGTSLSMVLARNGVATTLWGRNEQDLERWQRQRCNRKFLPDHPFPEALNATSSLEAALDGVTHVLLAVPSRAFKDALLAVRDRGAEHAAVVWATKGFEPGTGRLLHEVVTEVLGDGDERAVLSGPTFAAEVAAGLPTAITLASPNDAYAEELVRCFHERHFRVYTSRDLIGVQIGGGVKNVLALAAGIADGLGFGANSRAALITRGLAELMRLGVALGGQAETFMGLAGIGDLVLTCTDDKSRNRSAGLLLGKGYSVEAAEARVGQVVEGVRSAPEVVRMAQRIGVEMPICEQVNKVISGALSPEDAVNALLSRAAGSEH